MIIEYPFVTLPQGSFMKGANISDGEAFDNEKPLLETTIKEPFKIGIYPVTQAFYFKIIHKKPSTTSNFIENYPVDNVSWDNAIEFCNRLSEYEGINPFYELGEKEVICKNNKGYRLPTEAEWEYACKAGTSTRYFFGNTSENLHEYAWFKENSENKIHCIGLKKPNPFGLYDIIGNVWEWCFDYYVHKETYRDYAEKWPKLSDDAVSIYINKTKVLKGGAFDMTARALRSSNRDVCGKSVRHLGNSFRIVKNI